MSNRQRPSQTPERRQLTRRQLESQNREANLQRRVVLVLSSVVGLALLLIIGGILYDRLYLPSRTVAQVNNETLTRGEYEQLLRTTTIDQMTRSLQFAKLFGANQSFGQGGTFDQQIVEANLQLTEIGTMRARQQPVDDTLVNQWIDRQVLEQAAAAQYQVDPAQGEVDQLLVAELGSVVDSSEPLTETGTVSETATAAATAEPNATAAATATPQPTPTLPPAEATNKAGEVVDSLYTELTNILGALPEEAPERQRTPHVTKEEIAQALRYNFEGQLIRTKVGEALVKEVPADDASTPQQITARHILLKVPQDEPTATAEPDATETAEAAAETATVEPTPSPTPSAEELEAQFAERKAEADAIYQQLQANPESFAEVAEAKSEDIGSATQGGNIGAFDRQGNVVGGQQGQTLVPEFTEAAWALKENEISQPVRTQFGWHIIQRTPEDPEAKLDRLRQDALTTWLAEQRSKATIEPAPTPTATVPAEEAPETGTAEPSSTTTP